MTHARLRLLCRRTLQCLREKVHEDRIGHLPTELNRDAHVVEVSDPGLFAIAHYPGGDR